VADAQLGTTFVRRYNTSWTLPREVNEAPWSMEISTVKEISDVNATGGEGQTTLLSSLQVAGVIIPA